MRRIDLDPDVHTSPPREPEVYETSHGELTFYRQDFRNEVADVALSYFSEEGRVSIPLLPYPEGEDRAYDVDETVSGIWWKHVQGDLEATGSNPLEGVMALFEEEGNVIIEDVKAELTRHVPTVLEAHGIPVDYDVNWARAEYAPLSGHDRIDELASDEGGTEASEAVTALARTPNDLPEHTRIRGEDSEFPVEDAVDEEPIDEGEVPDYLLETESEPWQD